MDWLRTACKRIYFVLQMISQKQFNFVTVSCVRNENQFHVVFLAQSGFERVALALGFKLRIGGMKRVRKLRMLNAIEFNSNVELWIPRVKFQAAFGLWVAQEFWARLGERF